MLYKERKLTQYLDIFMSKYAEMQVMCRFLSPKCKYLMVFFILCYRKMNMFGFWIVGLTKQDNADIFYF